MLRRLLVGPSGRTSRDERGAVALFVAASLAVLLIITALAVDLGMQRVARRDAQAIADLVSLDMARELDGRAKSAYSTAALDRAFEASIDRNDDGLGAEPDDYSYELGRLGATGSFESIGGSVTATAVKVTAVGSVGYLFTGGRGDVTRSAVSMPQDSTVCFSVGSRLLILDTSSGALSPILDQILKVNMSAVGYEGLVNLKDASIPLIDLAAALSLGTTEQVLNAQVSLSQLMLATAEALRANGDPVRATVLESISVKLTRFGLRLGDILDLDTGTPVAGLTGTVNVLDLIGAAIVAANGENAIAVAVPGIGSIKVIEPPRTACASPGRPATAKSAQIQFQLATTVPRSLDSRLTGTSNVRLDVEVGSASATYVSSEGCNNARVVLDWRTAGVRILPPPASQYGQVHLEVTPVALLNSLGALGSLVALPLNLLGLSRVGLDVLVAGSVVSAADRYTFNFPANSGLPPVVRVPPRGAATPSQALNLEALGVRLSAGQGPLENVLSAVTNVVGIILNGLVGPVVNSVVNPLVSGLLNALWDLIGLDVGTADLRMLGRPSCRGVRLMG